MKNPPITNRGQLCLPHGNDSENTTASKQSTCSLCSGGL
uniref:Uncharacterized protein n=1 Tax=Anopheles dirus TaxID=7168 RepID=A0A182NYK3_9DIPT